ncbi:MAG: FecR domain-containing protein [Planctomycetia bacterium]|nr:FecR domain-containing protein [Planctomycetia bacterium]
MDHDSLNVVIAVGYRDRSAPGHPVPSMGYSHAPRLPDEGLRDRSSGGTAVIEGPAVFEPISGDAIGLSTGSIRYPAPGTKLRVETPTGLITDLGTEFAVSVEAGVHTRVGVFEGKVRLDAADAPRLVTAGQALSIDPDG